MRLAKRLVRPVMVGFAFSLAYYVLSTILIQVGNLRASQQDWLYWSSNALDFVPIVFSWFVLSPFSPNLSLHEWFPLVLWFVFGTAASIVVRENRKLIFVFLGGTVILMGCGFLGFMLMPRIGP